MPTISSLRRLLGERLGTWGIYATSVTAATGADPARWVIARFTGTQPSFGDGSPSDHVGHWVFMTDGITAGQQRRVVDEPIPGALAVDHVFSTTVPLDSVFELLWPLPAVRQSNIPGLGEIIVQALRDLWVPDIVDATTVANQRSYSLSAQAAWLDRPERVLRVLDPKRADGAPRQPTFRRWRVSFDGGTPTLQFLDSGYPVAGFSFGIEVLRPAYSLVNGAESTVGPAAGTDLVLGQASDIVTVAQLRACRWLAGWEELTAEQRKRYADQIPGLQAEANGLRHYLPRAEGVGAEMQQQEVA